MSNSWLKLVEEFTFFDLVIIILVSFPCVYFDAVIELSTKIFASLSVQISHPLFNFFASIIDDILQSPLLNKESID